METRGGGLAFEGGGGVKARGGGYSLDHRMDHLPHARWGTLYQRFPQKLRTGCPGSKGLCRFRSSFNTGLSSC